MLNTEKWSAPVETKDIWSLPNFTAWLDTKRGAYDYFDADRCAVAQYLTTVGAKNVSLYTHQIPKHIRDIVEPFPHIFGAARKRARKL